MSVTAFIYTLSAEVYGALTGNPVVEYPDGCNDEVQQDLGNKHQGVKNVPQHAARRAIEPATNKIFLFMS